MMIKTVTIFKNEGKMLMVWIKENSWWLALLLGIASLFRDFLEQLVMLSISNPLISIGVLLLLLYFLLLQRSYILEKLVKKKDSEPDHSPSSLSE